MFVLNTHSTKKLIISINIQKLVPSFKTENDNVITRLLSQTIQIE